jgi:deoxyribodipyrimidine photo-lyase
MLQHLSLQHGVLLESTSTWSAAQSGFLASWQQLRRDLTVHVVCCMLLVQAVLDFVGGEGAALARLKYYLWDSNLIATYFDTRNGMLGERAACRASVMAPAV